MGRESVIPGRDEDMTGAELRLIRTSCGLTQAEFGEMVGVADKSVRGWETATDMRVPVDVADTARGLHIKLMDAKQRVLDEYQLSSPGDEVTLPLYRRGDFPGTREELAVANAAAGLAFHELTDDGISVWVEWA